MQRDDLVLVEEMLVEVRDAPGTQR